ncbi:MAG: NADP-dependent isocitrate dehydrogenase [Coraliomargaritaceae bacterium]
MNTGEKIIYTITDEAPALATFSLLPIIQAFTKKAGIQVETRDISLAARVLSQFPDCLSSEQKQSDDLLELGELAKLPEANIIKLPNISASIPQLKDCINELQAKGYAIPDYPENPDSAEAVEIKKRYDSVKGSAVNPVLREGNSDRRCSPAVKAYAKAHPHSMGAWDSDIRSKVSSMSTGDFFENEQSVTFENDETVSIQLHANDGEVITLKESLNLIKGEVLDASFMSIAKLRAFLKEAINLSKEEGLLFSLHMKATMMKVSDPIIFGHAVSVYFESVFSQYSELFESLGVDERNGLGDVLTRLENAEDKNAVTDAIAAALEEGPDIAMVNSDKGITNLHVPSDVIIDASMPAAIRTSGKMWNPAGELQDTNFVIPDRCYAGVYGETIRFCKENGAFDPKTMGTVSNVGLMAKKAEEYGSHDKTFEIAKEGIVKIVNTSGETILEHSVSKGDIWRACQVKDAVVKNWVELAVERSRDTGAPAIFWLNSERAHDAELIKKVEQYLSGLNTDGLEVKILAPVEATRYTLERIQVGKDTISVTGNVLRDYLTDLFPILELGTSAKMLSIVPLMNGGGLFETGAGGSAPKHVQQFTQENHLRWDSLGEFLALGVSLQHLAKTFSNDEAAVLASALDQAIEKFLMENRSPSRRAGELDNRGSHFYLALYWAEAMKSQTASPELANSFLPLYESLNEASESIISDLNAVQSNAVDLGGYFQPNESLASKAMRPCDSFNTLIDTF